MANLPVSPGSNPGDSELRASDVDREQVADVLRRAAGDGRISMAELEDRVTAAYNAKTYAELEPLTRDLPALGAGPAAPPATPVPAPVPHIHTSRFAIAIMGGFHRRGSWLVARRFTAFSLMGGGTIDLREAKFTDGHVAISAVAVMGGIEIIAPEEAHVDVRGFGIMGGVNHGVRGPGQPGGPVVTVWAFALMGGVGVKRRRRKKSNGQPASGQADSPAAIADSPASEPPQAGEAGA